MPNIALFLIAHIYNGGILANEEFHEMFGKIKERAFRIQTLHTYSVGIEDQDYVRYTSGTALPERDNVEWLRTIESNVKAGRAWTNVHIVPDRLTTYMRYITDWWYPYHAKAGADIRFVLPDKVPRVMRITPMDFWLLDDTVVWMYYDKEGRFLRPAISKSSSDLELALKVRDIAMESSISLEEFLSLRRNGKLL